MKAFISSTVVVLLAAVAGCQPPISQQAKTDIAKPVNCATAEGDLRTLQSEKAHTLTQIRDGVTAISPSGIVTGVATGTEKDKAEVASGEYNKMIDQKIALIKSTCGIQ